MNTIQQIPAAKIVVIQTAAQKRFVLCYSASMGYYIAVNVKAEDIVICAANRARRMTDALCATNAESQIFFINEFGQEEMVSVHTSEVMEMAMLIKDDADQIQNPHTKIARFSFVNREGNYVRWDVQHGYHIDANSPANIYSVEKETDAVLACLRLNGRNYMFTDLQGNIVDSTISIFSQE